MSKLTAIEIEMERQMQELREFDEPQVYEYTSKVRNDKGELISQKCICGGSAKDFLQHVRGKNHINFCKKQNIIVKVNKIHNGQTKDIKKYRNEYMKKYLSDPDKLKASKQHSKQWRENNKEKVKEQQKMYREKRKKLKQEQKKLNKKMISFTDKEIELIKKTSKIYNVSAPHIARFIIAMIERYEDINKIDYGKLSRAEYWIAHYDKEKHFGKF